MLPLRNLLIFWNLLAFIGHLKLFPCSFQYYFLVSFLFWFLLSYYCTGATLWHLIKCSLILYLIFLL
jgi:hypothetical protein